MSTLYILCGVPGCGKSTWAYRYAKEHDNVCHVSRDEIRFSILKDEEEYFAKEKQVFKQFIEAIAEMLQHHYDVIADATHLNEFSRRKITQALDMYTTEYKIIYVVFNASIDTCLKHNSLREGRARVPENVIRNMYRDYRAPTLEEDERAIGIVEVDIDGRNLDD